MKRALCILLALTLALSFAPMPVTAADGAPAGFTDISDPETLRAANLLAALGIVTGDGMGRFNPEGIFNRAELTVIGCRLSGVTDVSLYVGTVKFPDVRAGHWAHGWVMAALDHGIITGDPDGNFYPERPMLYGHLVTVLMKLLGYKDADVGLNWPSSFIGKAEALGLSRGMSFGAFDTMTRGQAARLIYNFLFLSVKGGTKPYLESNLKAGYIDVLLRLDVSNGQTVVVTEEANYPLKTALDAGMTGKIGKLMLDTDKNAIHFEPDPDYTYRQVTVREARATGVVAADGTSVAIPALTQLLPEEKTYAVRWTDILPGESLLLAYKGADLSYVYREGLSALTGGVMAVLASQPANNPLTGLFGSKAATARVVKNGAPTTWQTLERWDVLVYFEQANVIMASGNRFIGYYTKGFPNAVTPTRIETLGVKFDLWPLASARMEKVSLMSRMVFLLDYEGKIADVRTVSEVSDTPPVLVTADSGAVGTVTLGKELIFSGKLDYYDAGVMGQLCTMSNLGSGALSLSLLTLKPGGGDLDITGMTVGGVPVAPWCAVYECVGIMGFTQSIALSDIPAKKVPKNKILHAETGPSGYITTLLLDDVTGGCYQYGLLNYETQGGTGVTYQTYAWTIDGAGKAGDELFVPSSVTLPAKGAVVGLSARLGSTGDSMLEKVVGCLEYTNLTRYDFAGSEAVVLSGTTVPLATGSVYLPSSKSVMTVAEARAYCSSFTVYTDPMGYAVRLILGY